MFEHNYQLDLTASSEEELEAVLRELGRATEEVAKRHPSVLLELRY